MEDVRNTYRILVQKPLVKSFEEPRIKENRRKLNLYEAGWEDEGRDWLRSCTTAKFGISSIRETH